MPVVIHWEAMTERKQRPDASEIAPHANAYVDLLPPGDILETLADQIERTIALFESIGEERATAFVYAPGKWTAKQIAGHLSDTERILAYRALRIARGDGTPLPGFEQNDYVVSARSNERKLDALLRDLRVVRRSTLALLESLPAETWLLTGRVSEWHLSVRGIAYTTAGHEVHHYRILQERYAG